MQKNNNIFATEITKCVDSAKRFNQTTKDNLKLKFKNLFMKKSLVLFLMAMLVSVTALAQSTIKGKVVDEAGEAIIGASVVLKGSSQGTVTDLDGNFTIQAQPGGY